MTTTLKRPISEGTVGPSWCGRCRVWTSVGRHRSDGSFNPASVYVSDADIEKARENGKWGRTFGRLERTTNRRGIEQTRYAVALGKHLGTRT